MAARDMLMRWRSMARRAGQGRSVTRLDLAATRLASSETARHVNRDVVLELIRMHQPVSRAELSRLSGLQRSTVSLITEQLMEERWVREGAVAQLPRGRRPTLLGLNEQLALLVADVHPGQATLAITTLNGSFVARATLLLDPDPPEAIRQIATEMMRMRERHPDFIFEGIGISLPGRVDPESQELIFAPNLKWEAQPIRQIVEEMTGLPTELENAANATLLAELWIGHLDGVRDAVLVDISEGIGTGLLANGQLVTGRRGMAGEFGHIPLRSDGPRCACGLVGCWEVFASTEAALGYYRATKYATPNIVYAELLELAQAGDAAALGAIAKQAQAIGQGLRTVLAALSPEVIVMAGDVTGAWALYEPHVQAELAAWTLGLPAAGEGEATAARPASKSASDAERDSARIPRFRVTDDCNTTRLHGAAAIVLQRNSHFRSHT